MGVGKETAGVPVVLNWTDPAYVVARLLKGSNARSVAEKLEPTVAVRGTFQVKWFAAAGATVTSELVPVMEAVIVSVAVISCWPAVFRVTGNVPAPLVRVLSDGNPAFGSVLMKCTVPGYSVAVLLKASCAVNVTLTELPATTPVGAGTTLK